MIMKVSVLCTPLQVKYYHRFDRFWMHYEGYKRTRTAAEIDIGTVSSIFPQSGDDTGTEDLVLSLRVRADGWNGIFSVRFGACVLYKLMEHII